MLERARLFRLLDDLARRPCIWICGPAGSGKTTLVDSWLVARERQCLWYQVDAGDRDPAALCDYLTRLAQAQGADTAALPRPTAECGRDWSGFVRHFARRWFELLPEDITLVLDNHHEGAGEVLDAFLREFVEQIPPRATLLVISRFDLPAALVRLAAAQRVGRLGWDALRLTEQEAHALACIHGTLDASAARLLYERCGGWAAGMVLMSAASFAHCAAGHYAGGDEAVAFAYFANEVFDRLDPGERELLLRTSLLPQFSARTAQTLSGNPAAESLLQRLVARHYFTQRQAGPAGAYRYHDLFRGFLLQMGERTLGTEAWRDSKREAAHLLAGHGEPEGAAAIAAEVGDWSLLSRIVGEQADAMLRKGRWMTLVEWLERLPAELREADPTLLLWHGRAVAAVDSSRALQLLAKAHAHYERTDDKAGQIEACAEIIQAYFQGWRIDEAFGGWLDRLGVLHESECGGAGAQLALSSLATALYYRRPDDPRLPALMSDIERRLPSVPDASRRIADAALLFDYYGAMAAFERCEDLFAASCTDADRNDCAPNARFVWWERAGHMAQRANRLGLAEERLRAALDIAHHHGLLDQSFLAWLSLAMVHLGACRTTAARECLRHAQRCLNPERPMHRIGLLYVELWSAIQDGDLPRAGTVWDAFGGLPTVGVPIHAAYNHPVVWYLARSGALDAARSRVERWRLALQGMNSPLMDYNVLAMEAYLAALTGDGAQDEPLRAFLALGARHGYTSLLSWIPDMMATICSAALRLQIEPEHVRGIIHARGLKPPAQHAGRWPRPVEIRTFGALRISVAGTALQFPRKTPKKPIALLTAIVSAGAAGLSTDSAQAQLWPELDGDKAAVAFGAALLRLRRLLGGKERVQLSNGVLRLALRDVWVDCRQFEDVLQAGDLEAATALYRGPYLPERDDEPWVLPMRERLQRRLAQAIEAEAVRLEAQGACEQALAWSKRGIAAVPVAERLYRVAMRCMVALGWTGEAIECYDELESRLASLLGTRPSAESRRLAASLWAMDTSGRLGGQSVKDRSSRPS